MNPTHKCPKDIVRRLNLEGGTGTGNGFYASCVGFKIRCNRARRRHGVLEVYSLNAAKWFRPSSTYFVDVYGRRIEA